MSKLAIQDRPGVTACECTGPGVCARHQCQKSEHAWHLCRTDEKWFQAGERGTLLEQRKPGDALDPGTRSGESPRGVGTELHRLLGYLGIHPTPGCKCPARIRLMNRNGVQWCEENVDTIVGWLAEEAKRQKLPFLAFFVKRIVQLAIHRAKKREKLKKKEIA